MAACRALRRRRPVLADLVAEGFPAVLRVRRQADLPAVRQVALHAPVDFRAVHPVVLHQPVHFPAARPVVPQPVAFLRARRVAGLPAQERLPATSRAASPYMAATRVTDRIPSGHSMTRRPATSATRS